MIVLATHKSRQLQLCRRILSVKHSVIPHTNLSTQQKSDRKPLDTPTASEGTNRWRMFVPAMATHMCLGASYGWSTISYRLSLELGMVSPAPGDWSLDSTTWPMAIIIASGGVSAALLSKWTVKVGVRRAMATGSLMFGSGMMMASVGVTTHNLLLLYLGNVVSGVGYGCAYTPPLQVLMDWFPDKRGLASGVVIAGFGSGALPFTSLINSLAAKLCVLPTLVSTGEAGQHVLCTASDLARLPYPDLSPGLYLVGSGNTGLGTSLAVVAALYSSLMLTSALTIARPPPGYCPRGYSAPITATSGLNVPVENVLKTPQFWLLFSTATLLATGGMGIMSVASPLVQEVFTPALPLLVTPAFASAYVMALSVANLSGRVVWASVSDKIGRRATFHLLCLSSVPLYASLPSLITGCVSSDPASSLAPLYLTGFCVSSFLAVTIMGGVFSVLPPYEADLYGSKYVGAIHSKFLPFSTVRGIIGPAIFLHLRSREESRSIDTILRSMDPEKFKSLTGEEISAAQSLIEAKSLTLSKLVTILPPDIQDPSPFLYDSTMYTMAGLAACSALLHFYVKPVDRKYFEKTA